VTKHKGIEGNQTADQLEKGDSLHPFIGPEHACTISDRVVKWAIGDWMRRDHQKYQQSNPRQSQAKIFFSKLPAKRTVEFLKLRRSQARQVIGLLTGHCYLKGHLFKMGTNDSPVCGRCHKKHKQHYMSNVSVSS
jgi:hypothetical protein